MRYIFRFLSSRIFNLILLITIQFILLFLLFFLISEFEVIPAIIIYIINTIVLLVVLNRKDDPSYRLLWTIVILLVPYVGGIIYLLFADKKAPKSMSVINTLELVNNNILEHKDINIDNTLINKQIKYLENHSHYPCYNNTLSKYYIDINDTLNDMLNDLENAKSFIFMEYFIVDKGYMLNKVLDVLKRKVKDNVKVYFMYDDAGCITTLPLKFKKELEQHGINTIIFSPLKPRLEIHMNNRDHRKITVIDNKIGYMGSFNLADEYINKINKYGYWKDSGVRFEGEAVLNLTVMFIQFYNSLCKDKLDYNDFKLSNNHIKDDSIVIPFSDSPTDKEDIGHNVHLNLINNAQKYIYIQTPYLILDYTLIQSLQMASKNGVEVIIVTPGIPDKKFVYELTKYNYLSLINDGIKIYEYTNGFLHSKTILVDDELALIGTINMDYRSYYLHYECGALLTNKDTIKTIKEDFNNNIINISKLVHKEDCTNISLFKRIYRAILNVFSPLI